MLIVFLVFCYAGFINSHSVPKILALLEKSCQTCYVEFGEQK